MTEDQIKQKAEAYAKERCIRYNEQYGACYDAYIAGAHSRDREVMDLEHLLKTERISNKVIVEANEKLRNTWISVKERLPEVEQYVFTHQTMNTIEKDAEYGVCQYLGGNRWWQADVEFAIEFTGSVDYWMSIPSLKGGEK